MYGIKVEAIDAAKEQHDFFKEKGFEPIPIFHVIYADEAYHVVTNKYFHENNGLKSLYSTEELLKQ